MYTRCPHCNTLFQVGAEELDAAGGAVRCGLCLRSFDARPGLTAFLAQEAPTPPAAAGGDAESGSPPAAQPEQEQEAEPGAGAVPPDPFAALIPTAAAPPDIPSDTLPDPDVGPTGPPPGEAPRHPRSALQGRGGTESPEESANRVIPPALRDDLLRAGARASRRRLRRSGAWALAVLLLATAAAQALLLDPRSVQRLPAPVAGGLEAVRPWHEALLRALGRPLPPYRDPQRIALVSRDVRTHPRVDDALLVTGVLANRAPLPQSWPRLRLTLYDINGRPAADRVFAPGEYRVADTSPVPALAPGVPVPFRLELAAPPAPVVGFELDFE